MQLFHLLLSHNPINSRMADEERLGVIPSGNCQKGFFLSEYDSEYKDLPEQVPLLLEMHHTCTKKYCFHRIIE